MRRGIRMMEMSLRKVSFEVVLKGGVSDVLPHNHPVSSVCRVLSGEYMEERFWIDVYGAVRRDYHRRVAGDSYSLSCGCFHRIELVAEARLMVEEFGFPVFHACRKPEWGFLDFRTGRYTSVHEYDGVICSHAGTG